MDRIFSIDDRTKDDIITYGCTHIAEWRTNESTRVILKKIVDEQNDQLFDFHQVNYFTCKMHIVLLTCVSCV